MAKCRGWRCSPYENTARAYVINSEGAAELIVLQPSCDCDFTPALLGKLQPDAEHCKAS